MTSFQLDPWKSIQPNQYFVQEGLHYVAGNRDSDTLMAKWYRYPVRFKGFGSDDKLYGGDYEDWLDGGEGNDKLYGGKGNDLLWGDEGNDELIGNTGNDRLYGGLGNDSLYGGEGDDLIEGLTGFDKVQGGAGNDTFWLNQDDGYTHIEDFTKGEDVIKIRGVFDLQSLDILPAGSDMQIRYGDNLLAIVDNAASSPFDVMGDFLA